MIELLLPLISTIIQRVLPGDSDEIKAKRLEIESELTKAIVENANAQIDVNKVEAANPSLFVAGWRPAIGWCGALGFAYVVLVQPLLAWAASYYGMPVPPILDSNLFSSVMMGMLGLGGMRSFEKFKGVDTKRWGN